MAAEDAEHVGVGARRVFEVLPERAAPAEELELVGGVEGGAAEEEEDEGLRDGDGVGVEVAGSGSGEGFGE